MKVIKYNPDLIPKISDFFNDEIEKCEDQFIMFIYDDVYEEVKNLNEFVDAYALLLIRNNLPFAFFPYYIHFNKVLTDHIKFPNPRAHIQKGDFCFDIVNQPSLGMLVIDVNKIKDAGFKFSGKFDNAFYVQELVMFCKEHDLYHSTLYFYDVYESWTYLKSNIIKGHLPNVSKFKEEKEIFYKNYKQEDEGLHNFIAKLKDDIANELQVQMDELDDEPEKEEMK